MLTDADIQKEGHTMKLVGEEYMKANLGIQTTHSANNIFYADTYMHTYIHSAYMHTYIHIYSPHSSLCIRTQTNNCVTYLSLGTWYGYLTYNEEEYLKIKSAKDSAAGKDKKKKRK